jgi:hypothetical protein
VRLAGFRGSTELPSRCAGFILPLPGRGKAARHLFRAQHEEHIMERIEVEQQAEQPMRAQMSMDGLSEADRREQWLDNALEETFPASDPIASGRFN